MSFAQLAGYFGLKECTGGSSYQKLNKNKTDKEEKGCTETGCKAGRKLPLWEGAGCAHPTSPPVSPPLLMFLSYSPVSHRASGACNPQRGSPLILLPLLVPHLRVLSHSFISAATDIAPSPSLGFGRAVGGSGGGECPVIPLSCPQEWQPWGFYQLFSPHSTLQHAIPYTTFCICPFFSPAFKGNLITLIILLEGSLVVMPTLFNRCWTIQWCFLHGGSTETSPSQLHVTVPLPGGCLWLLDHVFCVCRVYRHVVALATETTQDSSRSMWVPFTHGPWHLLSGNLTYRKIPFKNTNYWRLKWIPAAEDYLQQAKRSRQSKSLIHSTDECISKIWHKHSMEYYSAIKRKENLIHGWTLKT